jgi:hypothetical protein
MRSHICSRHAGILLILYDAFVAYSADDYNWVYGPLQTYLENNQGFRLALHERDFIAGTNIVDNIIDTNNTSKKIIFVIS